jgi:NAD(P)-dependent dehydrogenase (short-subunit alcohol dehydrogenase family)
MNIIVNGATKGIGKEIALILAKNPMNRILATGRTRGSLESMASHNTNILSLVMDLSDFDTYAGSFQDMIAMNFQTVDIVINIAGLMIPEKFMMIRDTDARKMMETNFFGPAAVIRIVTPFCHDGSHIVNISSMGGFQGSSKYTGLSYYSASKAALACLTECLATEFLESGIKINCLALGAVQTDMLSEAFPGYEAPVSAVEMAEFICDFALKGNKFFNGKILPVAVSNP